MDTRLYHNQQSLIMAEQTNSKMVSINLDEELWNHFYTVHSLIIIGSKEKDGSYNFAPKHMAMPLGFGPYFGFMGTPRKSTYQNIAREKVFTVSYPQPNQVVLTSLAASRREEDNTKPIIENIPAVDARKIEGKFLKDAYLQLECELHEITGQFGEWEIIVGKIVAAHVHKKALKKAGDASKGGQKIFDHPLLAYLHPDRFGIIKQSNAFPLPKHFKR